MIYHLVGCVVTFAYKLAKNLDLLVTFLQRSFRRARFLAFSTNLAALYSPSTYSFSNKVTLKMAQC